MLATPWSNLRVLPGPRSKLDSGEVVSTGKRRVHARRGESPQDKSPRDTSRLGCRLEHLNKGSRNTSSGQGR